MQPTAQLAAEDLAGDVAAPVGSGGSGTAVAAAAPPLQRPQQAAAIMPSLLPSSGDAPPAATAPAPSQPPAAGSGSQARREASHFMWRLSDVVSAAGRDPAVVLAGWTVRQHPRAGDGFQLAYHLPGGAAIAKRRRALEVLGLNAPLPAGDGNDASSELATDLHNAAPAQGPGDAIVAEPPASPSLAKRARVEAAAKPAAALETEAVALATEAQSTHLPAELPVAVTEAAPVLVPLAKGAKPAAALPVSQATAANSAPAAASPAPQATDVRTLPSQAATVLPAEAPAPQATAAAGSPAPAAPEPPAAPPPAATTWTRCATPRRPTSIWGRSAARWGSDFGNARCRFEARSRR